MKRLLLTTAGLACAALMASTAQAAVINGFSINLAATGELNGLGAPLTGTVTPVDEFNFRGIARARNLNAADGLQPGDVYQVDGRGQVTQLTGNGSPNNVSSAGEILNFSGAQPPVGFELTFEFSVPAVVSAVGPQDFNFVHTGPQSGISGLLDFYVDGTPDAVLDFNGNTISGITNGTPFASFEIVAGDGGGVSGATLDGSDDATFRLVSALPGVLIGPNGEDLSTYTGAGGTPVLFAFADSNFDLDPDNNGLIDSIADMGPDGLPGVVNFPNEFQVLEDGSLVLQVVPEPASLMAFAVLGVVGLGSRRRRKA